MPPNQAIRYFEEQSFVSNTGVTTAGRPRQESGDFGFGKFWDEYYSRLDRKLEAEVLPKLKEFTRYPTGWDSYNAPPLREDTAVFALYVLNTIMKLETPLPQIVPSPEGGVQLEWHEKDIDLELYITAPFECEIYYHDLQSGRGDSICASLTNDFAMLKEPIEFLTFR